MAAFSAEELGSIRDLFANLDTEKAGHLSLETLQALCNGVSREDLEAQLRDIVGGECTRIQMNDFIVWVAHLQGRPRPSFNALAVEESILPSTSVAMERGRTASVASSAPSENSTASRRPSNVAVSLKLPPSGMPTDGSERGSFSSATIRRSLTLLNAKKGISEIVPSDSKTLPTQDSQSIKRSSSGTSLLAIPGIDKTKHPSRRESSPLPVTESTSTPKAQSVPRRRQSTPALPARLEQKMQQLDKERQSLQTVRRISRLVRESLGRLSRKSAASNAESTPTSDSKHGSSLTSVVKPDDGQAELSMLIEMKQLVLEVQRLGLPSYIADVVADCMRHQDPDARQIQQTGDLVARLLQDRPEFEPPTPMDFSLEMQQIRAEVCGKLELEVDAVQHEVRSLNELVGTSWSTIAAQKDLIRSLNNEAQSLAETTRQLGGQPGTSIDPAAMQAAAQNITAQLSRVREGTSSVVKELSNYVEVLYAKDAANSREPDKDPLLESLDDDSVFDGTLSYTNDSCFSKLLNKNKEETPPFGTNLKTHIQRLRQRVTDLSASAEHRSQMVVKPKKSPTKRPKKSNIVIDDEFCTPLKPLPLGQGSGTMSNLKEKQLRGGCAPNERDEMRSVLQAALDNDRPPTLDLQIAVDPDKTLLKVGHPTDLSPQSAVSNATLRRPADSPSMSLSAKLTQPLPSSASSMSPSAKQAQPLPNSPTRMSWSANLTQPDPSLPKECRVDSVLDIDVAAFAVHSQQDCPTFAASRDAGAAWVGAESRMEQPTQYLQATQKNCKMSPTPKDMLSRLKWQTEELRAHAERTEFLRDAAAFALKSGMTLDDAVCHLQGLPARPRWQQRHQHRLLKAEAETEIPEAPTPPEAPPEEHWHDKVPTQDSLARPEHYIDSWLLSSGAPIGKSLKFEDSLKALARVG